MKEIWYIYELIDPRDNKPFYVGKGKGKRVHDHEKEALKGVCSPKCNKINDIIATGFWPSKRKMASLWDEKAAYKCEAEWINFYGIENLTNQIVFEEKLEEIFTPEKAYKSIEKHAGKFAYWLKNIYGRGTVNCKFTGYTKAWTIIFEGGLNIFYNKLAPSIMSKALESDKNKDKLKKLFGEFGLNLEYGS